MNSSYDSQIEPSSLKNSQNLINLQLKDRKSFQKSFKQNPKLNVNFLIKIYLHF